MGGKLASLWRISVGVVRQLIRRGVRCWRSLGLLIWSEAVAVTGLVLQPHDEACARIPRTPTQALHPDQPSE